MKKTEGLDERLRDFLSEERILEEVKAYLKNADFSHVADQIYATKWHNEEELKDAIENSIYRDLVSIGESVAEDLTGQFFGREGLEEEEENEYE